MSYPQSSQLYLQYILFASTSTWPDEAIRENMANTKEKGKNWYRHVVSAYIANVSPETKPKLVADSWEDDMGDDIDDDDDRGGIREPSPTPTTQYQQSWTNPYEQDNGQKSAEPSRRPEKQTAVAGRMIAGALGVRAPKKTDEQRAYDRATRENEIRRRDREKERVARDREEEDKAKAAIWDG